MTCHLLAQVSQIKSEKNMCLNSTELHHVYTRFPKQNNEDDFSTSDGFQERPPNVGFPIERFVNQYVIQMDASCVQFASTEGLWVNQSEFIPTHLTRSFLLLAGERSCLFSFNMSYYPRRSFRKKVMADLLKNMAGFVGFQGNC